MSATLNLGAAGLSGHNHTILVLPGGKESSSLEGLSFIVPFVIGVLGYVAQVAQGWFEARK